MVHTDFYLASSGLIPLLAIAPAVTKRIVVALPESRASVAARINSHAPRVQLTGLLIFGFLFAWAEAVCLRSLEVGHSAFGGAPVVWVAFVFLGLQIVGDWIMFKLPAAFPSMFAAPEDD